MKQVMKAVLNIIEKILLDGICFTLLLLTIFIVSFQVFNRFILHYPVSWTEEFSRYTFVWLCLLGSVIGVRERAHIKVDIFVDMFSKKIQSIICVIGNIIIILLLAGLMVSGIKLLPMTIYRRAATLNISMFYLYVGIPVSAALMLFYLLKELLKSIKPNNNGQ